MASNQKIWTDREVSLLHELRGKGLPIISIQHELKKQGIERSYGSIQNKLREPQKKANRKKKAEVIQPKITFRRPYSITHKIAKFFQPSDIINTAWIFDSHFPFNINEQPLVEFLKDFKPDIMGFGGDNWSLDCISHWNQQDFNNLGWDNVIDQFNSEAARFKHYIGKYIEALPNSKFVYLLGNHEEWLNQFSSKFPQTTKPTIKNILGEYGDRIEFVEHGGFYQIGKLWFCHGDQFGTQNPAKQAVERTAKSIVMGHHHVYKVWPRFSMVDIQDKTRATCVPCYSSLAPKYLKGRPTQWENGFFTACVKKKSGNFSSFVQPVSPEGHFMTQIGKEYK